MNEIQLPQIDEINSLSHANILFEEQPSGLVLPIWQKGRDGAANVALNGAVTAAGGAFSSVNMTADEDDLGTGDGATEIFTDSTGVRGFVIKPLEALTPGRELIVSFSVNADDKGAVAGLANAKNTELGTTTGASILNTYSISSLDTVFPEIIWNGTDTYKTIGVRLRGGTALSVTVELVEVSQ